MKDDLFIEMLEIFIQAILHARGVYPSSVFRRQQVYNTAAHICIHPQVLSYLKNVMEVVRTLKTEQTLQSVELVLYCEHGEFLGSFEEEILDRYFFSVLSDGNGDAYPAVEDVPQFLLDFEERARAGILSLDGKLRELPAITDDSCSFRVQLETSDRTFKARFEKRDDDPEVYFFYGNTLNNSCADIFVFSVFFMAYCGEE